MPAATTKPRTILIVSQTFVPDPAAVGQHVADAAFGLAARGHNVRVYASARGYENPSVIYPKRENLHGADVRRFSLASFGKKNLPLRVLGTAAFMVQAFFAAIFTPRLAGIFFSTSPPLIGLPLCIAAALRRAPTVYWAMDLNPDQLIALGKLKSTDRIARLLGAVNRFILRRATTIIALDRYMAARLQQQGVPADKMHVVPPWSHEQHLQPDAGPNPFRVRHGLTDAFVIMYSGNHSPSNPLCTLLDAAVQLRDEPGLRFLFVGGGSGKKEVETVISQHHLTNVLSLPYQPLAELKNSLTAADVHVVSLGDPMVGIIHPCKVYGAMAIGKPILYLGPRPSHVADILQDHAIGSHIAHGDTAAAVAAIRQFLTADRQALQQMGLLGQSVLRQSLAQSQLCTRVCEAVEQTFSLSTPLAADAGALQPQAKA